MMQSPVSFRIILGENDAEKLVLESGVPNKVDDLKNVIKREFSIEEDFRLQYLDKDFNDFFNLTSTTDLINFSTIKVIRNTNAPTSEDVLPTAQESYVPLTFTIVSEDSVSLSTADTDILSSTESTASSSSSSTLRTQAWPTHFLIPDFSYEVDLQLAKANQEFLSNGTPFSPSPKVKSTILEALASEILKFKAYPTKAEFEGVAKALIEKHPCLKEQGSVCGYYGWKISLKYKIANCRTRLRNLTPELSVNSLRRGKEDNRSSANQVKKPRRAEVNYLPDFPVGEDKSTLEVERLALLSEVDKRDNHQLIKAKMEKTFALRRNEVVNEMPFISEFKKRWPGLFSEEEICAEFARITTVQLKSRFMAELDMLYPKLSTVCRMKGGEAGRKIKQLLAEIDQNHTIGLVRACYLKALVVYLNEDPEKLIKEYQKADAEEVKRDMERTVIGIYVKRHAAANLIDLPEDVGIIIEGVIVLNNISDIAVAVALLFGIIYALNLSYPSDLKYTFEFLQKILMGIDGHRLSNKVQILKNKLSM